LFAVIVAIGLGVMAAFVARTVSGPAAATQSNLVTSSYSGPGPDAQERNKHIGSTRYADDKPSTGHGQLP
jgi:hypothetical protein